MPMPISSGVMLIARFKSISDTAICTSPDPHRRAAVAARTGAPSMPLLPPTTSTRPNNPLCPSAGRSGSDGNRVIFFSEFVGLCAPCEIKALSVFGVGMIDTAQFEVHALLRQMHVDPTAWVPILEDIRDRRQIHAVHLLALANLPVMR